MATDATMAPRTGTVWGTPSQAKARPLDRAQYLGVFAVGLGVVLVLSALVLKNGHPADTTKAAAAAGILALVAALAVIVERVLEGFWTMVDAIAPNRNWPFSDDARMLSEFATHLGTYVKAPLDSANEMLNKGDAAANDLLKKKPQAQEEVDALLKSVNDVMSGQADPKKWHNLTSVQVGLADFSKVLSDKKLAADLQLGVSTLDTLSGWMDSLVKNPGRKIMSLFAGTLLGLAAAWMFGLDLVHAALNVATPAGLEWGMVATGIAIGLGSNPTHELIAAIQSYRQQRQDP